MPTYLVFMAGYEEETRYQCILPVTVMDEEGEREEAESLAMNRAGNTPADIWYDEEDSPPEYPAVDDLEVEGVFPSVYETHTGKIKFFIIKRYERWFLIVNELGYIRRGFHTLPEAVSWAMNLAGKPIDVNEEI